jgi:hypothetical protein
MELKHSKILRERLKYDVVKKLIDKKHHTTERVVEKYNTSEREADMYIRLYTISKDKLKIIHTSYREFIDCFIEPIDMFEIINTDSKISISFSKASDGCVSITESYNGEVTNAIYKTSYSKAKTIFKNTFSQNNIK